MNLDHLVEHLEEWHSLYLTDNLSSDLDAYLEADGFLQLRLAQNPPNPLPCDYNSEKEKLISENDSPNWRGN